jgi:Na+/H+ antiporter NhaD/arsenite permease-like protein
MSTWLTLGVVSITYLGIAAGRLPALKANRTTITLMGAGLLIALGLVPFEEIGRMLDLDTLILLFSMMVLNANLKLAGFFTLTARSLLRLTRSPRGLLAVLVAAAGVLSALFLNDTICLMLTPLVLEVCLALERNPIPYLVGLATAANIGSTATLTGNPQNMIIGVASGISYAQFSLALLPVALAGLVAAWGVIVLLYRREFEPATFSPPAAADEPVLRGLLIKCLVVVAGLLVAFLAGVPVAKAALIAACVLLFTRRVQPHLVFAEFDWGLLVFFASLFIVTGALEVNGVTGRLFGLIDFSGVNALSLSAVTLALSNLVSNVPAVMLMRPVVAALPDPTAGWLTLAAASTLAGNLTLLGSVANLIVAEIAARWRVDLNFWAYTKAGVVITLITTGFAVAWLALVVW